MPLLSLSNSNVCALNQRNFCIRFTSLDLQWIGWMTDSLPHLRSLSPHPLDQLGSTSLRTATLDLKDSSNPSFFTYRPPIKGPQDYDPSRTILLQFLTKEATERFHLITECSQIFKKIPYREHQLFILISSSTKPLRLCQSSKTNISSALFCSLQHLFLLFLHFFSSFLPSSKDSLILVTPSYLLHLGSQNFQILFSRFSYSQPSPFLSFKFRFSALSKSLSSHTHKKQTKLFCITIFQTSYFILKSHSNSQINQSI